MFVFAKNHCLSINFSSQLVCQGIFLVEFSRFPICFCLEPIENPSTNHLLSLRNAQSSGYPKKALSIYLIYKGESIRLTRYIQQVVLMSPPVLFQLPPPKTFLRLFSLSFGLSPRLSLCIKKQLKNCQKAKTSFLGVAAQRQR